ncbi:MAG: hypothetical protein AB1758_34110 [Candidatus Eremiobacterota bacterium]
MTFLGWLACVLMVVGFYFLDLQPKLAELEWLRTSLLDSEQKLANHKRDVLELPEQRKMLETMRADVVRLARARGLELVDEDPELLDEHLRAEWGPVWRPVSPRPFQGSQKAVAGDAIRGFPVEWIPFAFFEVPVEGKPAAVHQAILKVLSLPRPAVLLEAHLEQSNGKVRGKLRVATVLLSFF